MRRRFRACLLLGIGSGRPLHASGVARGRTFSRGLEEQLAHDPRMEMPVELMAVSHVPKASAQAEPSQTRSAQVHLGRMQGRLCGDMRVPGPRFAREGGQRPEPASQLAFGRTSAQPAPFRLGPASS